MLIELQLTIGCLSNSHVIFIVLTFTKSNAEMFIPSWHIFCTLKIVVTSEALELGIAN